MNFLFFSCETFIQEEESCLNVAWDISPSESVVGAADSVFDTPSSCDNKKPPAPLNIAFDLSKNTKALNDTDFEDAVDEMPQELVPAVSELFNTTADLEVLDRAISAQPSFRNQALKRWSLYRMFDPLVGADVSSPAQQPVSKPLCSISTVFHFLTDTGSLVGDESQCLMGQGDSPVASGRQLPVDQLLDITVAPTTPHLVG
ncbi:hypothetical protein EB796_015844 [Bugula neritina]|uniref:Uncharacterized protein n=1 Tax=Bugula neritina TaxID=10212 RepID=A0A7J7JIE8_BUGNE|nr:hypothetical protein EB796_015844 [Bugula neritina]